MGRWYVDIVKFVHGHHSCFNPLQLNTPILLAAWTRSGLLCFSNCSEERKYLSITHLYPLTAGKRRRKNSNQELLHLYYR